MQRRIRHDTAEGDSPAWRRRVEGSKVGAGRNPYLAALAAYGPPYDTY